MNYVFSSQECCIFGRELDFSERALFPGLVFFFPPVGTFDISDMAEDTGLDRDGHLHQEGEDEEADRPDPKGHHELQEIRDINVDFPQRIGDKTGYHETRPLLNPDPYDHEKATYIEGEQPFSRGGNKEDEKSDYIHRHGCPDPRHELVVPVESLEQILEGGNVDGIRIILLEYLRAEQEEVNKHGIGNQLCNLKERPVLDLDIGYSPDHLKDNDHDGRPRA